MFICKKVKLLSAEREVQKIILASQKNTKKLSQSFESMKMVLNAKIDKFDNVAGVYNNSTGNENEEVSAATSKFKEFKNSYLEILAQMKGQKTATKDIALNFGIATKRTINRTVKYIHDDLKDIKNKMNGILQGSEGETSVEDIKKLLNNEDKHSYKASLEKIKTSANKGLGLSRSSIFAITKVKKIGRKHSDKMIIFEKSTDIKEDFITAQNTAIGSMYESCRTDARTVAEKYKNYFSNDEDRYNEFLGLLENCSILSAQNKYQEKTIKSFSKLKSYISKINFSKIEKEIKLLPTQDADKDVKKRNKSIGAKILTVLKNICKAIAIALLWILGIGATVVAFVIDVGRTIFAGRRSGIGPFTSLMWAGIFGISVAAFS